MQCSKNTAININIRFVNSFHKIATVAIATLQTHCHATLQISEHKYNG